VVGQAGEAIPYWLELTGAILILLLSVKPVGAYLRSRLFKNTSAKSNETSGGSDPETPEACIGGT
jgi:hypothetical protein